MPLLMHRSSLARDNLQIKIYAKVAVVMHEIKMSIEHIQFHPFTLNANNEVWYTKLLTLTACHKIEILTILKNVHLVSKRYKTGLQTGTDRIEIHEQNLKTIDDEIHSMSIFFHENVTK